jgi:hemoglobin
MPSRSIPLVQHHAAGITEAMIQTLVERFYARVRKDEVLGPIFEPVLAVRWDEHIGQLADFWSSVILKSGRYAGKPHAAHQSLSLEPDQFTRWLALFERTAQEVCPPDAAAVFVDRAHRIAESLQIGLGIGPKALRLP